MQKRHREIMIIFGQTINDEWIKYPKEKSLQKHVRTSKIFQELFL